VALGAAMLVFGATITKSLIPALDTAILKQKAMAAESAAAFRRAAFEATGSFKTASKQITSLDYTPKGVQGMAAQFKAGTVSAENMNLALKKIAQSKGKKKFLYSNIAKESLK
jgi:hypothetical protein